MPPKLNKTTTKGFCSKLENPSIGTKSYFEEDDYEFDDKIKNLDKKLKAECDEMDMIDELLAENELRIAKLDAELDKFLNLGEATAEKVTTEPKSLDLLLVNRQSSSGTAVCRPKQNKQVDRSPVHKPQLSSEQSVNSQTKCLKLDYSGRSFDLKKYLTKFEQKKGQPPQDRPSVQTPLDGDDISKSSVQNPVTSQQKKLKKIQQRFRNSNDGSVGTSTFKVHEVFKQKFLSSSSSNSDDVCKPQKLPNFRSRKFSPIYSSPVNRSQKKRSYSVPSSTRCLAKCSQTKKQSTLQNIKHVQDLISNRLAFSSSDESVYSDSDDVIKPQLLPTVKRSKNRKRAPTENCKPSTSVEPKPELQQVGSGPDIDLDSLLDALVKLSVEHVDKLQPSSNKSPVKERTSSVPPCKTINNNRNDKQGKEKILNRPHLFSRLLNGERCFPDISEIPTTKETLYMAERDAYLLFRQQFADKGNVGTFVEQPNEFEEFFSNYLCGTSKISVPICLPETKLKKIPMDPGLQAKVLDLSFDFPDQDPELIALLMNQKFPVWINPQSLAELVTPYSLKRQISATDVRLTVPGSVAPKQIPVESINLMSPHLLNDIEALIKSSAYLYPTDESVLEEIKDVIIIVPEKTDESDGNESIDNNKCIIELHPFHVETFFQLRGTNTPLWFPGMYTAFPDGESSVKLISTPSTLISTGWKLCAP